MDLDLDLIINPDFSYEWKDIEDYRMAMEQGIIFPEWTREIETAKNEILDKLEKRQYPIRWLVAELES